MIKQLTLKEIIKIHQAGGVLHSKPEIAPHDILQADPASQKLANLWQAFIDAQEALNNEIDNLTISLKI